MVCGVVCGGLWCLVPPTLNHPLDTRLYEWTAKAQMILCTCGGLWCLVPPTLNHPLDTRLYEWTAKAQMILCTCAELSESAKIFEPGEIVNMKMLF